MISRIVAVALSALLIMTPSMRSNAKTSDEVKLSESLPGVIMTTANLKVRTAASTKGAHLTTLSEGTMVEAIERCSNGWYKVIYNTNGAVGYVSGAYVRELDMEYYCVVNSGSERLNFRDEPNGYVRVSLASGTRVPELIHRSDWDNVLYSDRQGYMSTAYLIVRHY